MKRKSIKPQNRNAVLGKTQTVGFTLIELIVVMAILAILVLLAAPKLLGYSDKARTTQITNDIKVLESKIDEYLIEHEEFPAAFSDGVPGEGQLYDRTGKIEAAPGNLKVVNKTFYPETNLLGDFYTDIEGNIVYEDSGENTSTPGGETIMPDIDREFVNAPVPDEYKNKPLQGEGTESNPWKIWYIEHLDEIDSSPEKMDSYYVFMRDLDFDRTESYLNSVENMPKWSKSNGATTGWEPIGNDVSFSAFSGHLDGNGFGLFNLYIDRTGQSNREYYGLFTEFTGGSAENLSLLNVLINAEFSGALFAWADVNVVISNINISGKIYGDYNGGVFSELYYGDNTIIEDVNVKVTMEGAVIGGVFSSLYDISNSSIRNINADVVMTGTRDVGGVGSGLWNANNVEIENLNIKAQINGFRAAAGFAYLDDMVNSSVRNITINVDITGNEVAGFAYMVYADSLNVEFITGNVEMLTNEGAGLIYCIDAGWNDNLGKISDVDLNIDIQTLDVNEYYEVIGGLVSILGEISIERVTVTGDITMHSEKDGTNDNENSGISGNGSIGGIFGTGYNFTLFNDVTYVGNITTTGVGEYKVLSVGGLGGDLSYSYLDLLGGTRTITPITNSKVSGNIQTNGSLVGGLLGRADIAYITNSIKDGGTVSGEKYVGGAIGRIDHTYKKYDYVLKVHVRYLYPAPENTNLISTANVVANEYYGDIVGHTVTLE